MSKSGYMDRKIGGEWKPGYYAIDQVSHCLKHYAEKPMTEAEWGTPITYLPLVRCHVNTLVSEDVENFNATGNVQLNKAINSSNITKLMEIQKSTSSNNLLKMLDAKCYFELLSAEKWLLCAVSRDEMEEWIQAIDLTSSLGLMVEEIETSLQQLESDSNLKYLAEPTIDLQPVLYSVIAKSPSTHTVPTAIPTTLDLYSDNSVKKRASALVMATDNMLQSIEMIESHNRDRLQFVTKSKWESKVRLQDIERITKLQLTENESQITRLKDQDTALRNQLSLMNEEVAMVEKMIRASFRLQGEATVAFTHAKNNVLGAANMLRKRYADSRSPSAQLYIQLLNTHFPNESPLILDSSKPVEKVYTMFDVMTFYSDYYDNVHLPRQIDLDKKRKAKLKVWKQLVQCVSDNQNIKRAIEELHVILREIKLALHPNPNSFINSSFSSSVYPSISSQTSGILNVTSLPSISRSSSPLTCGSLMSGTLYSQYRSATNLITPCNAGTMNLAPNSENGKDRLGSITSISTPMIRKETDFTSVGSSIDEEVIRPDVTTLMKAWIPETEASKISSICIYKPYWNQLMLVLAELRYFRVLEATVRKELDATLQSRENLQLFKAAC